MTPTDFSRGGVDLHCAAGSAPGFDFTSPEPLLAAMDASGVGHAALGPIGRWAAVDNEAGNRELQKWCERWPGRFSRWVTVNPWYPDAAARLAASLSADVAGLKLIPAVQGFSLLQQALVRPLLEVAAEHGKPVYVVTGVPIASEPFQLAELARRFPTVTFVLGRSGRTDYSLDLTPTLRAVDNIVAETAYNGPELIAELAALIGPNRIAFASDAPFNDLDLEVARLRRADLSANARHAIFTATARRLLGRAV